MDLKPRAGQRGPFVVSVNLYSLQEGAGEQPAHIRSA